MRGLPPDSRTGGQWPVQDQLLAVLAEIQDAALRSFLKAHTKKGTDVGKPVRIDWPGRSTAAAPARKPSSKAEIREFFQGRVRVIPKGVG